MQVYFIFFCGGGGGGGGGGQLDNTPKNSYTAKFEKQNSAHKPKVKLHKLKVKKILHKP